MGVHVSLILKPLPPPSPSHPSVLSAPALSTLSHALNLDWQSVSHMIIFMFVDCFSNFYLNTWWTFLWPHIVSCHFAPLWGPSLSWKYTPIFLLLWPLPALTDSSSSSQTPYVCDLPLLHCSELHASALSSRGGCDDHFSLISPNFEVDNSLPLQVHELLEGTSCLFVRNLAQTCDYECLLNECSNPVRLTQNAWNCDRKPPFTWKNEVVMHCVSWCQADP